MNNTEQISLKVGALPHSTLTFNVDKTVRQTFTHRPNSEDLRLNFDGQIVLSVTNHKHLGLNLSNDLHFHQHINSIIRTVHTFLGPIYPIAKLLPWSTLNEIYMTYIRPHDYCDIIYDGNITSTDSIRLQILQNRCARLVTGTLSEHRLTHYLKTWAGSD